jgi:8-oxo-dGTP diphosphatase
MTEEKTVRVAVDMIVEKDGKILMGKRLNAVGAGEYGLPGGHLEIDESLHDAAYRELLEETGLVPEKLEFISVVRSSKPDPYVHFLFKCIGFKGEPENKEPDKCEGWEWFDPNQLPENVFQSHKDFIPAYLNKKILVD